MAGMIEFAWWNLVLLVLVAIIIKSRDFTAIVVSYLIALWVSLQWVITKSFTIEGRLANITEYVDAANQTIKEYAYQSYTIPQNFLDFTYTVFLAVLTLYAANKIMLTDMGKKMKIIVKRWWNG